MPQLMIRLPFPSQRLHPNSRYPASLGGVTRRTKLIKKVIECAQIYTMTQDANSGIAWHKMGRLEISYRFFFTSNRPRSHDNLITWMKYYRRGIARGLGIDDREFHTGPNPVTVFIDKMNPRVEITIQSVDHKKMFVVPANNPIRELKHPMNPSTKHHTIIVRLSGGILAVDEETIPAGISVETRNYDEKPDISDRAMLGKDEDGAFYLRVVYLGQPWTIKHEKNPGPRPRTRATHNGV